MGGLSFNDLALLAEKNVDKTFDEVVAKPDGREQFVLAVTNLVRSKNRIATEQEFLKQDVDATADAFKIDKAQLNKIVASVKDGKVDALIASSTQLCDALDMFSLQSVVDAENENE